MTQKQRDDFNQLLLTELQEIKADLKEVRLKDVPSLQKSMAVFDERLSTVKEDVRMEAKRDARIYGGIGTALASILAIAMAYLKH